MKWFLIFWAGPIVFLAGWYWLSYYDLSFGIYMFSRQVHDLTFQIYGDVLGVSPETLPSLVARAIAVDSLVVFAILAFRKRKTIVAWWLARQASKSSKPALANKDSLSRAP
jgi:hypothetical protein